MNYKCLIFQLRKEHHSTLYYFHLKDNKVLYFSLHPNYPVQRPYAPSPIVPYEAQIQEKPHKNHTKSYYIPATHSANLSNHPWDIILWNKQKNCFTCNIIAHIPHSDNCQSSKMNKYFKSIECQSKHHHMTNSPAWNKLKKSNWNHQQELANELYLLPH